MNAEIPRSERERLTTLPATLNGQRAKVSGVSLQFARVSDMKTGLSAEWSWHAVAHVMANSGGAFTA